MESRTPHLPRLVFIPAPGHLAQVTSFQLWSTLALHRHTALFYRPPTNNLEVKLGDADSVQTTPTDAVEVAFHILTRRSRCLMIVCRLRDEFGS